MHHLTTVASLITEQIEPNAQDTDRTGEFPSGNVAALAAAGLLGLVSSPEVGGAGGGLHAGAEVIEQLASTCGSTAMILCMHYAGAAVIEQLGPGEVRRSIAAGEHLTTLAFSEQGSRSHFWAPLSTATPDGDAVELNASKSWVTSAGHADSYVWSSRPSAAEGASTLWLVPSATPG